MRVRDYVTGRVLAWLAIVVLGAWFGIGRAEAACDVTTYKCGTRAEAYTQAGQNDVQLAGCTYGGEERIVGVGDPIAGYVKERRCATSSGGWNAWHQPLLSTNHAWGWGVECSAGSAWNETTKTCAADCSAEQPFTGGEFNVPNGSLTCNVGSMGNPQCYYSVHQMGDGTTLYTPLGSSCPPLDDRDDECNAMEGYYWNAGMMSCIPIEPEECEPGQDGTDGTCTPPEKCPAGMVEDANGWCKPENSECPAGQVESPLGACLPGEGQCAAGEVRGEDGTCKKDADGDGQPDADDPNNKSFSGGDDCNVPPTCSGDPIACGQAKIQWRIDCNTRRNVNVEGGSCAAIPVCTGEKCDALEYAQLLQQWRSSCALQELAARDGSTQPGQAGDANGNGIPDELEGGVSEVPGIAPGIGSVGGELWGSVDRIGWLGESCPGLPTFTIAGQTVNLGEKPCEQGALLGGIIYTFFLVASAFVIGRSASGV